MFYMANETKVKSNKCSGFGSSLIMLINSECNFDLFQFKRKEKSKTWVLRKADGERTARDLLLKQILLVEEEDDGGLGEPLVVADGVEQFHAFMHAVLKKRSAILEKAVIQQQRALAAHFAPRLLYTSVTRILKGGLVIN